VDAGVG